VEIERRLLDAAQELLEGGRPYPELSVEEIAGRAGIGRTAFYFYFRDKRELLLRLTGEVGDELLEHADRWWHGEGDGATQLREQLAPIVELFLDNGTLMRAVTDSAASDQVARSFWVELAGRFIAATAARIEREQEAGRALPVPPRETATALVWMTERTLYQHGIEGGGDPATLIEALTGIWLRSIYGEA
jgi:TetR/AcrR family transcriptional regulator, ethionamide resistance regulator